MTMIEDDVRELDRRAVRQSMEIVARVRPPDLARATPCTEWLLVDLLRHMTVQHRGFAAAGQGHGADLSHWQLSGTDPGHDPVAAYLDSAEQVIRVFHAKAILEQPFRLPEISTTAQFPAAQAIGFHFIDYVVHGWDVARALGEEYLLDEELAPAALRIALAVPNGPERLTESAAFARSLPTESGSAPLERILRALGRDPAWPNQPPVTRPASV